MVKKVIISCGIIIVVILLLIYCVFYVPIFRIIGSEDMQKHIAAAKDNNASVLCCIKYNYSTGVSWTIEDSSNKELIGKEVLIYNIIDPRLLKENSDYYLDYSMKLFVDVKHIDKIDYEGEEVTVFTPKKIYLLSDNINNRDYYSLSDLSLNGWLKVILAFFNKNYRYCY